MIAFIRNKWNTNACCWKCAYIYPPIKDFASWYWFSHSLFCEFVMTLKCMRAIEIPISTRRDGIKMREMETRENSSEEEERKKNVKDKMQYKTFMSHDCFYHLQKCLFKTHPPTISICFAFFLAPESFFFVHGPAAEIHQVWNIKKIQGKLKEELNLDSFISFCCQKLFESFYFVFFLCVRVNLNWLRFRKLPFF